MTIKSCIDCIYAYNNRIQCNILTQKANEISKNNTTPLTKIFNLLDEIGSNCLCYTEKNE